MNEEEECLMKIGWYVCSLEYTREHTKHIRSPSDTAAAFAMAATKTEAGEKNCNYKTRKSHQ